MTRQHVLFAFATLLSVPSMSQPRTGSTTPTRLPDQGISLQLAGNAPILSLNYHRTLHHFRRQSDGAGCGSVEVGLGLGFTPQLWGRGVVTVPHYLSVNYGSRFFRGEIGYGGTNGRRGVLFERVGYQPGVITGLRLMPTPHLSMRLFAWSTFYQEVSFVQDPQFRVIRRQTQHIRVFPGLATIYHFNG